MPTLLPDPTAEVKFRSLRAAEDVETCDAALCVANDTRNGREGGMQRGRGVSGEGVRGVERERRGLRDSREGRGGRSRAI